MASSPILSDTFADSVISTRGPRWTRVTRYWPTLLWNAGTVQPAGADPFDIDPTESELHNKYHASNGVAAARKYPTAVITRHLAAFTHRLSQSEDQIVKATYKLVDAAGGGINFWKDDLSACVGARITGEAGTEFNAGSGYSEMLTAPSGYYLILMSRKVSQGNRDLRFALQKVIGPGTAGGLSTITELASFVHANDTADEMEADSTFGLRLSCVTNTGVVELRGYYTDKDGIETEILSHDEGTGGLTESGHALFGTATEMVDPVGSATHGYVMGVVDFEVQDGSGNLTMRDEFDRVNITSARQAGPDQFFVTGEDPSYLISGMYTGDQAGEDQTGELPAFGDRLERDAAIAKLQIDTVPDTGYHLFHQPASNQYTQAVSALVDFASGGSGLLRVFGVTMRRSLGENNNHSGQNDPVESSGYLIAIQQTTGPLWVMRLHRYAGGVFDLLAFRILNATGDPVVVANDTAFTLRGDIENRNGQNAATGNVHIDVQIDATRLTGWTINSPGIIEEDDGSLTDTSSERVLSGGATGFFASNNESGTGGGELFIESVQQLDVALDLTETEQKSAFVPSEKDGKSGTLTVPHEWPVETTWEDYAVAHDLDSAHVHRHQLAVGKRRRWRIRSTAAKKSEVDALRAFFLGQEGAVIPFDWVTPSGEAVVASMEEASLSIRKVDFQVYDFEVVVLEALGFDQEFSFQMFGSSAIPFSAGGVEITDDPAGDPTHPVFYFEDSYGVFTITVLLANTSVGGEVAVVDLSGDAVEGTHYTNDSDPGSNRVVLEASEGDTELTFTITPIATGVYHAERVIKFTLNDQLSSGAVTELNRELHAWLRSTTAPPQLEFSSASQSASRGSTVLFSVGKPTGSPAHEDNLHIYMEIDDASTAIEGVDYDWFVGPGDPNGLYTLGPSDTSRNVRINLLSGATSGRTVIVNLRHEESDRSERNLWTITGNSQIEKTEQMAEHFPGTPGDSGVGPATINPPSPLDVWLSDNQEDPWGDPVNIFQLRDVALGSGYHRKSFDGQTHCGGPEEDEGGGMMGVKEWIRYSFYVMDARPVGSPIPFPRFVRLGVRDRGFSLAPPQVPNATGLDPQNSAVHFDSEDTSTGAPTDSDGHTWGVYSTTDSWNSSSEYGIEIETLRFNDGTTRDVARLWIMYHEDDATRFGHAMSRNWYPVYFGQWVEGEGENLANNKGKGIAMFWPLLEISATVLTGAPPPFQPRTGFFDGPAGGAVALTGGTLTHTITVS